MYREEQANMQIISELENKVSLLESQLAAGGSIENVESLRKAQSTIDKLKKEIEDMVVSQERLKQVLLESSFINSECLLTQLCRLSKLKSKSSKIL